MTKTNSSAASARPTRVPLHQRSLTTVRNKDDGFEYRIVNANLERDPERVQRFQDAGWEVVPDKVAGQIGDSRVDAPSAPGSASQISVGQGTKAVLMRIRSDWFQEDQSAKQAKIDELEGTMSQAGDYGSVEKRPVNSSI